MNGADSRRYRRGAALLTIGVGSSGLLTYAYFALASHELEPDEYGSLVVLWSALFIAVFTLYRPVEQFISRSIAQREARGAEVGEALRTAGSIQIGLAVAFVAVALLLRAPIENDLLDGESTLYAVLLVAAPAYAVSFFARGYLAGRGRFGLYGAMLLIESTSRFSLALATVVGLASGVSFVALGIAVAPLLSLAVVPLVVLGTTITEDARAAPRSAPGAPAGVAGAGIGSGGRFVGAAFAILLSEQALLNVGVLVAGVAAGPAAAGFLFNVMLIARAPQVLFGAVTTSLLPSLSRIRAGSDGGSERAFRKEVASTVFAVVGFAALAILFLLAVGPAAMQLTFGDAFDYDRAGLVLVAAGMGMHLSALALTQAALAGDQAAAAAGRWVACAVVFTAFTVLPVFDLVRRAEVGYALAAALLLALVALLFLRAVPVADSERRPRSP